MNCRQIVWLAALMAAQAAVLSLLHAHAAQAETVYRCSTGYQQQPCEAPDAQSRMEVRDARTGAQMAQAKGQRESELKAFRQFMRHRRHEIREQPASKAVALTAARTGDGPFERGPALSDAKRDTEPHLERHHRRKHVRLAKAPRPMEPPHMATPIRQR